MVDRQLLIEGWGSSQRLGEMLTAKKARHVFLVTGKASYEMSGAKECVEKALASSRSRATRFYDFDVNPKEHDILRGVREFQDSRCDMILAVGGGSPIDMAKIINVVSCHEGNIKHLSNTINVNRVNTHLIAMPTTAGSGSEATQFAVYYREGVKHSVDSPHLLPHVSIVDPLLTQTLSPYTTAVTGMDALSQAMESYWSVGSTEESSKYSREAVGLIWINLHKAMDNDLNARVAMSRAALLSGRAINITRTTAPHALSYVLTTLCSLPHGHALCLTLPAIMQFNHAVSDDDCADSRGASFVRKRIEEVAIMLGEETVSAAVVALRKFIEVAGLNGDIRAFLDSDEQFRSVIKGVNTERLSNNPRVMDEEGLKRVLSSYSQGVSGSNGSIY